MGFLAPFMLLGAAAGGIPIALHFFFRSRYRTIPWAAMKFLLTSIEQTSRRVRFQEYLLLLARILVLVLLALALARLINTSTPGFLWLLLTVLLTVVAVTWPLAPFWHYFSSGISDRSVYLLLLDRLLVLALLLTALVPVSASFSLGSLTDLVDEARDLDIQTRGLLWLLLTVVVAMVAFAWFLVRKRFSGSTRVANPAAYLGSKVVVDVGCAAAWLLMPLMFAEPPASGAGKGEAVDAVFIFDTSYSMGAREGSETRLERARAAALGVLDQLPPHSTLQVITCADRATLLGPRAASNLDQARTLIGGIELTHLATDFLPGVKEAAAALRRGQSPNKELYLFSDMQKLGWERQAEALIQALRDIHQKAAVYLVRCGAKVPPNVAVVGIVPQAGVPRPGERVDFAVLVRNTGTETLHKVAVSLTVDGRDKEQEVQEVAKIDPGETRAVTLTGKMDKAGLRVVTAAVKHDGLEADNRFDQILLVRDHVRALVVDGAPNEKEPVKAASYYLMHALLPIRESDWERWPLLADVVSPRQASPLLLANQNLCILADVALDGAGKRQTEGLSAEFIDHLSTFVRQGHGLIIFGGDNVQPDAYNRVLGHGKGQGLLPATLKGVHEAPAREPLLINRRSGLLPGLVRFQDDNYKQVSELVRVWKTLEVEEPAPQAPAKAANQEKADPAAKSEAARVILRYNDGKPAVVSRRVGAGEVVFIATNPNLGWKADSVDPTWTNLPLLSPMYVPLLDTIVNHLLQGQTQSQNSVAGEPLLWHVPEKDAGRHFQLVPPRGEKVRLGLPEMVQGRPALALSDLTQAGVYRIFAARPPASPGSEDAEAEKKTDNQDPGLPLAVVPDLRESANLEALTEQQLDERLGFKAFHVIAGADPSSYSGVERAHLEWTPWVLAAVLVVAVGEALLAWLCGRAW
jgi:hypothetical protein